MCPIYPTVGAQGGGGTFLPPVEFMHTNCTIDKGHKILLICEEEGKKKVLPFQNGGHLKIFASRHNTPKFEEPLSQKSFLAKFGSN